MNNPFDFFDGIFCINLDSRKDKWEQSIEEFKKVGIEDRVERFSAIATPNNGAIGCAKSNIEVLKIAKERKLESVLILEDDIQFESSCNEILDKATDQLLGLNASMIYLGINPLCHFPKISDNLRKVVSGYTTHAYAVHHNYYDIIINNYTTPIDVYYSNFHRKYNNAYCVYPMIAVQRKTYSDIEKVETDNGSHIRERFYRYCAP